MRAVTPFTADWLGKVAVVIGNGPSLLLAETARPDPREYPNVRFLVANGGYKLFPYATSLMCSDRHWLAANRDLSGFRGPEIIVTRGETPHRHDPRMRYVNRAFIDHHRGSIFSDPATLVEGHNSTSTNISMACLRGVRKIILLGVDLKPGAGERRRTYDESTDDPVKAAARYARQVQHLTKQAEHVKRKGVLVLNCSPRSALTCYPYSTFAEAIRC